MKKGALRNFKKFTGKQLCQSLFFNKVAGLKPAILLKKRLWDRCFPVNFVKSLTTPFTEHLWATASEGIFKFPHHLMITMIIIRVHLKKKNWLLKLEHTKVPTRQIFGRFSVRIFREYNLTMFSLTYLMLRVIFSTN